jgi:Kdo2-lipid IVA lauroyltransferase/acyltransferase
MSAVLLRLLGRLPLAWLHALGSVVGRLVYAASPLYAGRMRENLSGSGIYPDASKRVLALRECAANTGKTVVEVAKIWFDDEARVAAVMRCETWDVVEEARRSGRGLIFLTPHLGCFEACAAYIAQRMPITVLYRPPRQRWLEPLMIRGRSRGQARTAPATLRGVRMFYKALQRGEAVGLLPDQAPQLGEGNWAEFFGRPAYTMTLVRRLQKQSGAAVIFVFAERLPRGQGYLLHFERYRGEEIDEAELNRSIENMIRRCPTQYLWSYNRYKVPKGAPAASLPVSSSAPDSPSRAEAPSSKSRVGE